MENEQFQVLNKGFRTSPSIAAISKAFCKAQAEFNGARKDSVNPAFRSKYADLSSVIEATQAALNKNGIAIMQAPQLDGQLVTITTRLQHESGEFYESDLSLPAVMRDRFDAQSVGSAITYGCRYSMQSMLCVPREDDDGQAAVGSGSKEAAQAVAKRKIEEHEAKQANGNHVPAIFYSWFDESQTARIEGDKALMSANKDILAPLWNTTAGAVVADANQLESLKYQFEERNVNFKLLKSTESIETQLKKSIEHAKAKKGLMPVVHDKEQLLGLVNALSERSYADGVLIDIPKARRREQAKNPQKQLRIGLEGDLKVRMATQIERYIAHYGNKGVAWDALIQRLEGPFDAEA